MAVAAPRRGAQEETGLSSQETPAGEKPEAKTATTPVGIATNAAVLGLAKAARSFSLYDPANAVVRTLIQDYRDKMRKALDQFGVMALDVHPFELVRGGEIVYLEKDRERSLSFRLFRDGVRSLTFLPSVTWEELLRLLEVFSIRFTGVRQQEDDLVTLLRKATFAGIEVTAVEGFVPDEEQPEEAAALAASVPAARRVEPPPDWDLPLPPAERNVLLPRATVPPHLLAALQAEEAPETSGAQAVRAVAELLRVLRSAEDRKDAFGFAQEVRDFLLVDADGPRLLDLLRTVLDGVESGERPAALASLLDDRVMAVILGAEQVEGPAFASLLAAAPPEALAQALRVAAREGGGLGGARTRRLLAAVLGAQEIEQRLATAPPEEAGVLLGVLAEIDRPRALGVATEACRAKSSPLAVPALALLGEEPSPRVLPILRERLSDPEAAVRLAAVRALGRAGPRGAPVLQGHCDRRHQSFDPEEAQEVGRALATASAEVATRAVLAWLEASGKNLLGRLAVAKGLQWVAAGALEAATGPDADALLRRLASGGDAEVRKRCAEVLSARTGGARG